MVLSGRFANRLQKVMEWEPKRMTCFHTVTSSLRWIEMYGSNELPFVVRDDGKGKAKRHQRERETPIPNQSPSNAHFRSTRHHRHVSMINGIYVRKFHGMNQKKKMSCWGNETTPKKKTFIQLFAPIPFSCAWSWSAERCKHACIVCIVCMHA